MASIVLGVGSSHGPTMQSLPARWLELGIEDEQDTRFAYAAARAAAPPGLAEELRPDRLQQKYDACQQGIAQVEQIIRDARADVAVLLSNPHGGVAQDRMQPTFGILLNDPPPMTTRVRLGAPRPRPAAAPAPAATEGPVYRTDGELARHLMECLVADGFDLACSFQSQPGARLDEAFTLLHRMYDPDAAMPFVPFAISRYLPNQATPRRCWELGQALRRAIAAWPADQRVIVLASGGLSHQLIDEELDRQVIDALVQADADALCSLPRDRLNRSPGTPEILNWVACAGAMAPTGMTLLSYLPCYRSLAGTGQGVTFGYWRPHE